MPADSDGPASSGPLTANAASSAVLRATVIPTVAIAIVILVVSWLARGGKGALAAGLAAVIVLAFFGIGQVVLSRILGSNPEFALSGALLVYITQIGVLFVLIALLKDATWLDPKIFALTIVVLTLVWIAAAVLATNRTKMLYVEPIATERAADEQ